ncbi:MAG: TldD/PmbA family protein [Armatimonadota bacterium]|jgi:PmbA protein
MSEALLIDRNEALGICERTLAASTAEQTEVNLLASDGGLTRFANNHIHQSVAESDRQVYVRAAVGRQVGVATTNDTSDAGLRDVAERACALASAASPDEHFPGLPAPGEEPASIGGSEPTADFGPERRAAAVRECIEVAVERGQTAAGACSAEVFVHAVANSLGLRAYQENTVAHMRMVFAGDDSSGYAEAYAEDASQIHPRLLAETAAGKCANSARPRSVEPGRWDVILEPPAVTDAIFHLGLFAFNALACLEGRSAICGRLGERVCGENITLVDDALDPRGIRRAFDFEGVPRRRVELVRDGIATGLVHDSRTAARWDTRSTGHAGPPSSTWGPVPLNVLLSPGSSSVEEMIAATERGLLVTRFHYTNMLSPSAAVLTGMTRDGTFLIEDGEVVGGVRNLRFTENLLEALSRVDMIGREGWLEDYAWAPALRIRDFRFSGATEF